MKKLIKLKESDIINIVKRVIKEQSSPPGTRKGVDTFGDSVSVPGKPTTRVIPPKTPPHTFGTSPAKVKMTPEIQNQIDTINALFMLGPCGGSNVDCSGNSGLDFVIGLANTLNTLMQPLYSLGIADAAQDAVGSGIEAMDQFQQEFDVFPANCCESPLWGLCEYEGQDLLDQIMNNIHPTFQEQIEIGSMNWCNG